MRRERIILCAAAALALVSTLYYRLPITAGLLFILIEVGGTFCLGRLLLAALKVDEGLRGADAIALSYALGYGASIVLYVVLFLTVPHAAIGPVYLAVSVAAAAWCGVQVKRGRTLVAADDTRTMAITFLGILLVIYTFTFMLPNFLPIEETNSYYLDNLFWVGNNVELTYSIPPHNFRNVLDTGLRYHYLSSIRMALIQMTLGAPAFEACFAYSFFDIAMLLSSSAVMFARVYLGEGRKESLSMLAVILLLFSTGIERLSFISLLSHLYVASFGFAESTAFMLLFLALAKRFWEKGNIAANEALTSGIVLALCMASKGTLGFTCMMVSFAICLRAIVDPSRRLNALMFGGSVLVAGLAIYYLMLSGSIWRNTGDVENVISLTTRPHLSTFYAAVRALPLPRFISEALFLLCYTFICNPILWIAVVVAFIQSVRARSIDALDAGLLITSLVCIAIVRLIDMRGFSQSYFMMAAYPLLWGFVLRNINVPERMAFRMPVRVLVGALACGISLTMGYQAWMPRLCVKSVSHLMGFGVSDELLSMSGFSSNIVSSEEYRSLIWVRENTPVDALFTADVYDVQGPNTYYPGAIAQRYVLRPWSIAGVNSNAEVESVFEGNAAMQKTCDDLNIDFYMQSNGGLSLSEQYPNQFEERYSSDSIVIYELM